MVLRRSEQHGSQELLDQLVGNQGLVAPLEVPVLRMILEEQHNSFVVGERLHSSPAAVPVVTRGLRRDVETLRRIHLASDAASQMWCLYHLDPEEHCPVSCSHKPS